MTAPLDPAARPPLILPDGAWQFAARILRWIDGDTVIVDCLIDLGFEEMSTKRRHIRIAGVNAPETHQGGPASRLAGVAAHDFVERYWPAGSAALVDVVKPDKFGGRDDGRVSDLDGHDVGTTLLEAGHAVPYDGGPR